VIVILCFFFSSRRRHTRSKRDWSSDVCSSDMGFFYCTSDFLTQDIILSKSTRSDLICNMLYFLPFTLLRIDSPVAKCEAESLSVTVSPTFKVVAVFLLDVPPSRIASNSLVFCADVPLYLLIPYFSANFFLLEKLESTLIDFK